MIFGKLFSGKQKQTRQSKVLDADEFRMQIADIIVIELENRGTILTGVIESGTVRVDDQLELIPTKGPTQVVIVKGIEMFQRITDVATKGENVGLLFADLKKEAVSCGDILQNIKVAQ